MNICFKDLEDEFRSLADKALEFSVNGFMHRDMQSRNIMVKNNRFYFIDFQGGTFRADTVRPCIFADRSIC